MSHQKTSVRHMTQTWRQLNNLTLDNLGIAPSWLKVVLLLICVLFIGLFGWMLVIKPMMAENRALMIQEQTLIGQYAKKYAKAQQLSMIERQTQTLNHDLAKIIESLPHKLSMSFIVEQLHMVAMNTGVQIVDIKTQPETELLLLFERNMIITIEGGYHELGRLLARISSLSAALTFHDFSIEKLSLDETRTKLRLVLHIKVYRAKTIDVTKELGDD